MVWIVGHRMRRSPLVICEPNSLPNNESRSTRWVGGHGGLHDQTELISVVQTKVKRREKAVLTYRMERQRAQGVTVGLCKSSARANHVS